MNNTIILLINCSIGNDTNVLNTTNKTIPITTCHLINFIFIFGSFYLLALYAERYEKKTQIAHINKYKKSIENVNIDIIEALQKFGYYNINYDCCKKIFVDSVVECLLSKNNIISDNMHIDNDHYIDDNHTIRGYFRSCDQITSYDLNGMCVACHEEYFSNKDFGNDASINNCYNHTTHKCVYCTLEYNYNCNPDSQDKSLYYILKNIPKNTLKKYTVDEIEEIIKKSSDYKIFIEKLDQSLKRSIILSKYINDDNSHNFEKELNEEEKKIVNHMRKVKIFNMCSDEKIKKFDEDFWNNLIYQNF